MDLDTNAYIIDSTQKKSKDEKKPEIKQEDQKMSAKKRKAMEKYLSRKLRKDEESSLMKKLGKTCITNSLLMSSKNIGAGQMTVKQKLKRALAMERSGMAVDVDVKLYQPVDNREMEDEEDINEIPDIPDIPNVPMIPSHAPPTAPVIPKVLEVPAVPKLILPEPIKVEKKPVFYVNVNRTEEIRSTRIQLPIVMEEQQIMEAISENSVVILSGETGSGKTTQVPQFLYEAGYGHENSPNPGLIGITQPRRVAAVSMAKRVNEELNCPLSEVSYQIRYDATVNKDTKIKFMTDGVLLKEISTDFLLTKYSCIIVDEAHERSLNTDILIGLLSRIIVLRNQKRSKTEEKVGKKIFPLKLIIMSATLRVEDFIGNKKLFTQPPPHINVDARQHPVTVHFNRQTKDNYIEAAVQKVKKINGKLPQGGILVFMTGQQEIVQVCKLLQGKSSLANELVDTHKFDENDWPDLPLDDFDEYETGEEDEQDQEEFFKGISQEELDESNITTTKLHIVPLYASMSPEDQLKVFQPPPENHRLCIVATNVAETSITIPGIKYVVDCGRVKERKYDTNGTISSFQINWISKASASQRAGRAGRTGPGHCYRLYSSALFHNQFEEFSQPEIQRSPIDGIVLQMKDMNIDHVVNFPFVSAPSARKLRESERMLERLNSLDSNGKITKIGRLMARFPVSPRLARVLLAGSEYDILPYAIALVSALSVGDPFINQPSINNEVENEDNGDKQSSTRVLWKFAQGLNSDVLKFVKAVGAWQFEKDRAKFCRENMLHTKLMKEINMLREQLSWFCVDLKIKGAENNADLMRMKPLNSNVVEKLKICLLFGFCDRIAIRDDDSKSPILTYKISYNDKPTSVYIHPTSTLLSVAPKVVIFHELNESVATGTLRMKGVTEIKAEWLQILGQDYTLDALKTKLLK